MSRPVRELLSTWEAAEARLYPVAMTRPEVYARALEVVREIVAELAPFGTVEGLAEAFERAAEISVRAIERSGVSAQGVDVGLAAGAAFALRYRAIVASSARRAARERIEDAREHRLDWVTIAESGDPATAPYLRLEMHLPEGTAVQASIGLDAETGERRFELAAVALDPATGERSDASTIATPQTFVDAVSWQEAVVLLRGTIEGTAG